MRHWILIFLIALTPLRGWAAGDMAIQMAAQQATQQTSYAITNVANYSYLAGTSGPFDSQVDDLTLSNDSCHGHASHTNPTASDDKSSPMGDHAQANCASACGACQVCHSVALTTAPALMPQPLPGFSAAFAAAPRFASADRALGLKPPIS